MKYRLYAFLLLLVIVFYISKPLLPYIEYAVFRDYIAKNLCINKDKPKSCCHGKCHLQEQLKKSADTNESEDKGSKKVQNKEVKEYLVSHISIPKSFSNKIALNSHSESLKLQNVVLDIFIPPKI